jgi:hypothetical protein
MQSGLTVEEVRVRGQIVPADLVVSERRILTIAERAVRESHWLGGRHPDLIWAKLTPGLFVSLGFDAGHGTFVRFVYDVLDATVEPDRAPSAATAP